MSLGRAGEGRGHSHGFCTVGGPASFLQHELLISSGRDTHSGPLPAHARPCGLVPTGQLLPRRPGSSAQPQITARRQPASLDRNQPAQKWGSVCLSRADRLPARRGEDAWGSGRSGWGHSIAGNSHPQTASQSSGGDRWADHFRGHWPGWGAWGEEGHSGKPGAGAWSRSPLQLPTGPSPCGSHAVLELGGSPPPPVREEEDAVVLAEQELNY